MAAANEKEAKRTRNATLDPNVAEEIQRALERLQRCGRLTQNRWKKALKEVRGNTYVLPEPLTLPVSGSTQRD